MAAEDKEKLPASVSLFADSGIHFSDDCVDRTVQTAAAFGAGGLVWGQLQNMFRNPPIPIRLDLNTVARQVMERESHSNRMAHLGRAATFFAVTGATFSGVNCAVAGVTGEENYASKAVAGCAAGMVLGIPGRKARHMLALCAGLGTLIGAVELQREQSGSVAFGDVEKWKHKVWGLAEPEDKAQE
eukprot:TRINITY_DN1307_c0_g1_i1.p1 TRINITY_DN1307_c0_g1~~TRINITY_DN1307_c0_g1_i1.p1  ORF type:complete len:186 (+),score=39.03 TRINITY_DN1307_c0_g1_i1:970-1527(+)